MVQYRIDIRLLSLLVTQFGYAITAKCNITHISDDKLTLFSTNDYAKNSHRPDKINSKWCIIMVTKAQLITVSDIIDWFEYIHFDYEYHVKSLSKFGLIFGTSISDSD